MKRSVSITFEIDIAAEWEELADTPEEAIKYALECIRGNADWPARMVLTCEGVTVVAEGD